LPVLTTATTGSGDPAQLRHTLNRQSPISLHFFFDLPVDGGFPVNACSIRCCSMRCKAPQAPRGSESHQPNAWIEGEADWRTDHTTPSTSLKPSVITSKPAIDDHFKTGQRSRTQDMKLFYRTGGS